jgi:hypothetical protein
MPWRLGAASLAILIMTASGVVPEALAQPALPGPADTAGARSAEPTGSGRDSDVPEPPASGRMWNIELKRDYTSVGTPGETTKTTLRVERFLTGTVTLLRLDLLFPDEETDFNGSPFDPHLGDTKVRVGFKALRSGRYSYPSFVEFTFPTANPESLGSGKYQVSAGISMLGAVELPAEYAATHHARFEILAQQVNSVAGDPSRKDINYTKFELTLHDVWRREYTAQLKLTPTIDWEQDGETGAVVEIEGGWIFARGWRTWLMLGHRAWGPAGIPGTYNNRVEIGVAWTF